MIYTTLNKLQAHNFPELSRNKLLQRLGKTQADDEPLPMSTILDTQCLGIHDALWCLRAVDGHQQEMRDFAEWCVQQADKYRDKALSEGIWAAKGWAEMAKKALTLPAWEAAYKSAFYSIPIVNSELHLLGWNSCEDEFRRVFCSNMETKLTPTLSQKSPALRQRGKG
jgi:alpha-galactosidase/6-phospho-beta-glucosidase family protein